MEVSGEAASLEEADCSHLSECAVCTAVAATERSLNALLQQARPAEDLELEAKILAALPPLRWRRRAVAFLPVAASLVVAILGTVMVGGVPGGSLLSLLPLWSTRGWLAVVSAASDWGVALVATARTVGTALPPATFVVAALVTVGCLVGLVSAALRWRRASVWRRGR
jgi:hypothetical protein